MPSRHIIPQGVTQETRQQQTRYNYEDSQNRSTHESWATIAKDCSETWANTCQNLHPERMLRIGGMTQEMSVTEQSTSTEWMLPRSLWLWNSWGPAAWTTHWHTCEWQCQAIGHTMAWPPFTPTGNINLKWVNAFLILHVFLHLHMEKLKQQDTCGTYSSTGAEGGDMLSLSEQVLIHWAFLISHTH